MALNLFNGTVPQSVTTSTSSQQGLPDWYQEYTRAIGGEAARLGSQDYTPYTGQRVAQLDPLQQGAYDLVNNTSDDYQPWLDKSGQVYDQALQAGTGSWLDNSTAYMNPYQSQVIDEMGRLGMRNWNENILPGLNDQFVGTGQFGSGRNADIVARAGRDFATDLTGQQTNALMTGYNTAFNQYNTDVTRQATTGGQIGQQYGSLGGLEQQLNASQAQLMDATGQTQTNQTQKNLDLALADWNTQKNWDWTNLDRVNSAVRGMQLPIATYATATGPANNYGPSPLMQLGSSIALGKYIGS